jgi:hemerythrin-like domain-containing protein
MISPAVHERRGLETEEPPVSLTDNTIDVSDMFPVHNTLRDTLAAAPRLVSEVDDEDRGRRDLIANFYDNVLAFLHVHHHGEEILVFPLLRERCAAQLELIDVVAGQHRDVDQLVAESGEALKSWEGGDVVAKGRCAQTLGALGDRMTEHLNDEEQQLLPLCATSLTEQEWGALPGHALSSFEGDKVWLILGLIRERMSEKQRADMLSHMPPPAVEMWTTMGEKSYVDLMGAVGPLT